MRYAFVTASGLLLVADSFLNFLPRWLVIWIASTVFMVMAGIIIRDAVANGIRDVLQPPVPDPPSTLAGSISDLWNDAKISSKIAHAVAAGLEQSRRDQEIEAEING